MNKKVQPEFLFDRSKYILLIVGLLVSASGYILMAGGGSQSPEEFSYELFNFRRLTLAPFLVLAGYGILIFTILKKRKPFSKDLEN